MANWALSDLNKWRYFTTDEEESRDNESLRSVLKEVRRWLKENPGVFPESLSFSEQEGIWSATLMYGEAVLNA